MGVHPLVLLSVTDHFTRVGKTGSGRVVGILLGKWTMGGTELDISNSFALPFDEDSKDSKIWFLDHDYLDSMFSMFKKVNARERIVGWYHTGPRLKANDMAIHELIQKSMPAGHDATLVVIDVSTTRQGSGLPTEAYVAIDTVREDGKPVEKTLKHLASAVGAEEAEEVGVEQLLRDVHNPTAGSLSQKNHRPTGLDPGTAAEAGANSRVFDEGRKWRHSGQSSGHVPLAGCAVTRARSGTAY